MSFGDKNFTYGPRIVKDGMVFYVDAANPRSYTPNDTKIYSLVGNSVGTVKGPGGPQPYPQYSSEGRGSWLFDGIDDHITFPLDGNMGATAHTNDINSYTICTFAKSVEADGVATIFGFSKGWAAYGVFNQQYWYSGSSSYNQVRTFVGGPCPPVQPGCGTVPWGTVAFTRHEDELESWSFYCTIITPTHLTQYFNDEIVYDAPATNNLARRNWFDEFWVGTRGDGAYWRGYIGPTLVYNRALTHNQVLRNYNALKPRFGL